MHVHVIISVRRCMTFMHRWRTYRESKVRDRLQRLQAVSGGEVALHEHAEVKGEEAACPYASWLAVASTCMTLGQAPVRRGP